MIVQVVKDYSHYQNSRVFKKGETLVVEDKANSDFYHIHKGNQLDLIPKKNCIIKNEN